MPNIPVVDAHSFSYIYYIRKKPHAAETQKTAITVLARTVIAVISPPKPINDLDNMAVIS